MPENCDDDLTGSDRSGGRAELPEAVSMPDSARTEASGLPQADAASAGESDALRILFQASAAAESLQQRFSELQLRRSELTSDAMQLDADRRAFEQRAQEFASQVARDRTEQREMMADLEQRIAKVGQQEELVQRQAAELRSAQRALAEERVILKASVRAELD